MSPRARTVTARILLVFAAFLLALFWFGTFPQTGYLVLAFTEGKVFPIVAPILAGVALIAAVWLGTRAVAARVVLIILVLVVAGVSGVAGVLFSGFASKVLAGEVVAVSADGRHDVVRITAEDWKHVERTELRVRTRAGLLSRQSRWVLAEAYCAERHVVAGDIRAEFTGAREVRIGGVDGTVRFDDTGHPDRYVRFCP